MYDYAVHIIKAGKAFVCDQTADEVREYRGTLIQPGRNSPYRNPQYRGKLDLFTRMKNGEFPDGSRTLRAKIDMTHPNLNMRDPICTGFCGRRITGQAIPGAYTDLRLGTRLRIL